MDALDQLFAGLADHNFFPVDEREQGIRRGLGPLDEVAVDVKRIAVEPGEFNHDAASDGLYLSIGGSGANDEGGSKMITPEDKGLPPEADV